MAPDMGGCVFDLRGRYRQGSPPSSVAAAFPAREQDANVHFSGESTAHDDRRQTPETHRESRWLRRPSKWSRPSRAGLGVSTNANHNPWCFISTNGCGTPASFKLSPMVLLAKVNVFRTGSFISITSELLAAQAFSCTCAMHELDTNRGHPWLRCPRWRTPSALP